MPTEFCQGVATAIADEAEAAEFYRRLANMAPTASARRTIRAIRRDELRYHRRFTRIQLRYCQTS